MRLNFIFVYIDGILVASMSKIESIQYNFSKSALFDQAKIKFLGHLMNGETIRSSKFRQYKSIHS